MGLYPVAAVLLTWLAVRSFGKAIARENDLEMRRRLLQMRKLCFVLAAITCAAYLAIGMLRTDALTAAAGIVGFALVVVLANRDR